MTQANPLTRARRACAVGPTSCATGGDGEADLGFARDVGLAFPESYPQIVRKRMNCPWTDAGRNRQLLRRSRYVEFDQLYDRAAQFGLKTGGHVDAILMSHPPEARWP